MEDRKQQQRIFRWLTQLFSLFDQEIRSLHCSLGFRRGIALDLEKRVKKRNLKLDLLAA
jgi:hypothetical protein